MKNKLNILQSLADQIDEEKGYYKFFVERKKSGYFLVPEEPRYLGDEGEFMGKNFEDAKIAITKFVSNLN